MGPGYQREMWKTSGGRRETPAHGWLLRFELTPRHTCEVPGLTGHMSPRRWPCPHEPRVLPSARWGCYTLAAPDLQGCGAGHGWENPGATPSLTSKWTFQSATTLLSPENAHLPASLLGSTLSRSPSGHRHYPWSFVQAFHGQETCATRGPAFKSNCLGSL